MINKKTVLRNILTTASTLAISLTSAEVMAAAGLGAAVVQEEEEEAMDFNLFGDAPGLGADAPALAPYNRADLVRHINANDEEAINEHVLERLIPNAAAGNRDAQGDLGMVFYNPDIANNINAAALLEGWNINDAREGLNALAAANAAPADEENDAEREVAADAPADAEREVAADAPADAEREAAAARVAAAADAEREAAARVAAAADAEREAAARVAAAAAARVAAAADAEREAAAARVAAAAQQLAEEAREEIITNLVAAGLTEAEAQNLQATNPALATNNENAVDITNVAADFVKKARAAGRFSNEDITAIREETLTHSPAMITAAHDAALIADNEAYNTAEAAGANDDAKEKAAEAAYNAAFENAFNAALKARYAAVNSTSTSTPTAKLFAINEISKVAKVSLKEAAQLWTNTADAVADADITKTAAARKVQILAKTKRDSDNAQATLNLAFGQVTTRLASLATSNVATTASAEGIAAGSDAEKFGVWGQAMGGVANQKARKGASGFKSNMVGGMIGVDTMINDNTILGLSFGNVINNVKSKDGDKTRSSSLVATAYGNYKFDNDFFIRGAAAYSNTAVDNKDKRINGVNVTGVARGKYHINSFGGEVAVGKIFTLANDVLVTPSIGARFARTGKISYKETGGAGFDNKVSQKASNSAQAIAGLQVAKSFTTGNLTITPELHANVAYGLGMKTPAGKYTNTLANETISYRGNKPSRFDSTVGFGVTAEAGSFEYGVGYDANISAGYLGHQGAVKLKVKF